MDADEKKLKRRELALKERELELRERDIELRERELALGVQKEERLGGVVLELNRKREARLSRKIPPKPVKRRSP